MLKTVVLITFLTIQIVRYQILADNGHREGYCYDDGIYIREGETVPAPIGKCYNIKCDNATKDNYQVSSLTCPAIRVRPGWYETEMDYTKPYPECCPKVLPGTHSFIPIINGDFKSDL